jgi:hypothetical protein
VIPESPRDGRQVMIFISSIVSVNGKGGVPVRKKFT